MIDKKRLYLFWKKALHKYRFVIMTDDSFEEKVSLRLSLLTIFAFMGGVVFFCFFAAVLLLTATPLIEYVPGKSTTEVQQELIDLTVKSDSLLIVLNSQQSYLQNIRNIIRGKDLVSPKIIQSTKNTLSEISFEASNEDSILRLDVESEDLGAIKTGHKGHNDVLVFFPPVKGMITDGFNVKTKHFGVDLVASEKTRISAVLEGTVIISAWTHETGYVVGIQHKDNYVSIYKHNSLLLCAAGDFVSVGEPVAVIGNSGELSSGPHLHFELWHQGEPVNPENYILF